MRKSVLIIAALVLLMVVPTAVSAVAPAPGGPFNTAFRVQNMSDQEASCSLGFYDSAGTEALSVDLGPIPVGQSAYVYVPDVPALAGGLYSGVVACDRRASAVVNFSDPDSGASYSAIMGGEAHSILSGPGVYDNYYGYYTSVTVQNASKAPTDITIEIYEPGDPTPVYEETASAVPSYGSVSFNQEGLVELAENNYYSARLIAEGQIAGVINIYGRGPNEGQLYSYNPFAEGANQAYAPVIMNDYYGYNTALVIQNVGTSDATVTITYGDGTVKMTNIAPGAADSRYTPAEGLPTGLLTGVKVESDEPVVLLVNESTATNRAASYSGFAGGSEIAQAPIVLRRYYDYNSSVTCQNIGTEATVMSIAYGGVAGTTDSPPVQPNEIHMFYQGDDPLLSDGFIGSATVTADQSIVCVVNQDKNEPPHLFQIMDMLYAYNGVDGW